MNRNWAARGRLCVAAWGIAVAPGCVDTDPHLDQKGAESIPNLPAATTDSARFARDFANAFCDNIAKCCAAAVSQFSPDYCKYNLATRFYVGSPGEQTVFNPDYAAGEMLSSLRAGIAALERDGPPSCFLLAFADQPAVQPQTVAEIVGRFGVDRTAHLVVPTHGGKRGHPIVLGWDLVAEIRGLLPDDNLRTVVHRHLPQATSVEVADASVLEDLDTPKDLERARKRYGN